MDLYDFRCLLRCLLAGLLRCLLACLGYGVFMATYMMSLVQHFDIHAKYFG